LWICSSQLINFLYYLFFTSYRCLGAAEEQLVRLERNKVAHSAGGITSLHCGCCYSFVAIGGQI